MENNDTDLKQVLLRLAELHTDVIVKQEELEVARSHVNSLECHLHNSVTAYVKQEKLAEALRAKSFNKNTKWAYEQEVSPGTRGVAVAA